jgi:hypothetical protein
MTDLPEYLAVGGWLREQRARLGYFDPPTPLAEAVGCTVEHLYAIEAGHVRPSEELLDRIVDELRLSRASTFNSFGYNARTYDLRRGATD